MRRVFAFLFSAAVCLADTNITGTFCGGNRALVSWVRYDINGAQIGRSDPASFTSGAYFASLVPGTDGSRYFVTVACPSGGTGASGYWLIPDTLSTLDFAKVAVAANVKITDGWYWDTASETWKNAAGGISGGGGGGAWGSIGGTLSNQTDLNNSLNGKEAIANKNAANGYAGLDSGSRILKGQAHVATLYSDEIYDNPDWLLGISALKITTGTVEPVRLGSGTASGSTVLFGNNTWGTVNGGTLANQAEAEAGVENTKNMTSLRVNQAFNAYNPVPPSTGAGKYLYDTGAGLAWVSFLKFVPAAAQIIDEATDVIAVAKGYHRFDCQAAVTLTGTPTITGLVSGDHLVIENASTINACTLQDIANLAGSGLRLGGANLAIGPRKAFQFVHNGTDIVCINCASSGGGQSSVQTVKFRGGCQNTIPTYGFSLPSTNAATPLCDSGASTLYGVLRFTADGQSAQGGFTLPPTYTSMTVVVTGRTSSITGNSVYTFENVCTADNEGLGTAGAGGPSFGNSQNISLAAKATANLNTVSGEFTVPTLGCAANEDFAFRVSRNATTNTTNPELIAVSFKVQ